MLSYSDLNLKLRAIYNDRKTRMVSYPRMVTLDNREVSFRSVVNQPVLGSSSSASLGAGATETSSVEYLPIGTVINILPKRMAGNKILLNVSVTVSDIIGTEVINGNPYPIATSRVYTAPLTVQSGYTVAISGLDAARTNENETGVPVLGRLPLIGGAFKNRKQDRSRQHLMMLITPVALNTGTEGLTEKPITREPWKAAPTHQPVAYGKSPVYEPHRQPLRAQPVDSIEDIDDVPGYHESASGRKANRTFGRGAGTREPEFVEAIELSPAAKVEYPDPIAPVSNGATMRPRTTAPVSSAPNTPMVVVETPEPVTAPAPVAAKAGDKTGSGGASDPLQPAAGHASSAAAPAAPAVQEEKQDPRIAGIRGGIDKLKAELGKVPEGEGKLSPDDAQLVLNVHGETQKLLDQVEEVRGDKSKPLAGELGDTWWDLIHLKSQAAKLSRRSPESLAVKAGDGGEGAKEE